MSKYELCTTVPSPLDVLSGNATLFSKAVCYRHKILLQVSQENYHSFIAVVAMETRKHFSKTNCPAKWQQKLASDLLQIFEKVEIKLDMQSQNLLEDCSSQLYLSPRTLKVFDKDFFAFQNWVDHLYN